MKSVLLGLLFLYGYTAAAQESYTYRRYTLQDGLSSNNAGYLLKDREGFLWMATSNGLNRFDGNAFDVFLNNPADSSSIASNEINNLFIDSRQRLWVTTMAGLSLYHPPTQSFRNYSPDASVLRRTGHFYPAITEDEQGNIWLGGWYDLLIFNPSTGQFRSSGWAEYASRNKPAAGNHSRVVVLDIRKKSAGEYWVLTSYGLYSVHTASGRFSYYPSNLLDDYYGCQLNYVDAQQRVWMGSYGNGILCFDSRRGQWIAYATPPGLRADPQWDWAYGITWYGHDTLIYSSQKGPVWLIPTGTGYRATAASGFPEGPCTSFYSAGNEWWLSTGEGIVRVNQQPSPFRKLPVPGIRRPGKIFTLDERRLLCCDEADGQVYVFDRDQALLKPVKTTSGKPVIGNIYLQRVIDILLLATDEQLFVFNEQTYTATPLNLPGKASVINPRMLRNIVHNGRGKIWIRDRRQGILELTLPDGPGRYLPLGPQTAQSTFSSLYYDSLQQQLWIGLENQGVCRYDPSTGQSVYIPYAVPPSHKGSSFTAFCGGATNRLYASDINYGLFVIHTLTGKYTRFTQFDGLASNNLNYACRDAAGNIWLSHAEGVSRLDTASRLLYNFPELKAAANYSAFISADSAGDLYMPGPDGYLTWNMQDIQPAPPEGKLYLRHIRQGELVLQTDSQYIFSHQQNNIRLQVGYLSFSNRPHRIEYRLNGQEWIPTGNGNELVFSNLAPNRYLLEIREKNRPDQMLRISLLIRPPFYRQGWFLALLALLTGSLFYGYFRYRLAAIRKQSAIKQQIAGLEMMALRAQMNPHFIFNCISSIDNFILGNDRDQASAYLNKFARLIRNILDSSKSQVIPFWKDWESLQLYTELEQLRSNDQFTCRFSADEMLLNGHYKVPALVIQPYVENAVHHGLRPLRHRPGLLSITAELKESLLVYRIEDNGIGREAAAGNRSVLPDHQSYGMQLSEQRIRLFNQDGQHQVLIEDLHHPDGTAAGTRVTVTLNIE